ncbi:hypothetical protein BHE18_15685 [Rossellomorea aquimaris]|uniref:Uncharacterized protein n=1 Tax=Rossellomorea aquimaris TaxID=189382 RepID=A0A1J6W4L8_9BACI|nr:hypothetical protein BHE18_15685 [Rossellomorea aquimaris]
MLYKCFFLSQIPFVFFDRVEIYTKIIANMFKATGKLSLTRNFPIRTKNLSLIDFLPLHFFLDNLLAVFKSIISKIPQ